MSNKIIKKQRKNLHKCLKHLTQLCNEECKLTDTPTKYVLLGNAGHANLIGRSDVCNALPTLQCKYKLFFPPHKQFSILYTEEPCSFLIDYLSRKRIKTHLVYPAFIENDLNFEVLTHSCRPPGLHIIDEIITPNQEEELMKFFIEELEKTVNSTDSLKNRATLHYGYRFDYKTNLVDLSAPLDQPIPEVLGDVLLKIKPYISISPDQLTVNIYQPGQGIPKHVDTHSIFTHEILSVSLGSDVAMDFKQPLSGSIIPVVIPARSLTVMTGESRYLWHHGIARRKADGIDDVSVRQLRISLTLRECTSVPCKCSYPSQCDSQNYGKPQFELSSDNDARNIESRYVTDVYEEIAEHFSHTRHTPWPGVMKFINSQPAFSVIADVGCGNGKYLGTRSDAFLFGNDNSLNLCSICKGRGHEIFACNALNIPLRDEMCDSVICIAMLHHITTLTRRVAVLQNLVNLLKPGGRGLVTVWAQNQYLDVDDTDDIRPCNTNPSEGGIGRRQFDSQDVFVDWQKQSTASINEKTQKFFRYYHVFNEVELRELFNQVRNVGVESIVYEKANWFATFTKRLEN